MVGGEISVVDGGIDVRRRRTEYGERVGVVVCVVGMWYALGRVLGFGVIDCEAGVVEFLLYDSVGFVDEVGRDTNVEVVKVGVSDSGSVRMLLLVRGAELL